MQLFLLLEGLRAGGWTNFLVAQPQGRVVAEAIDRGFDATPLRMRNHLDLVAALRLVHRFRSLRVDLVHLHSSRAAWLGGLAAAVAGRPALAAWRLDRPIQPGPRTGMLLGRLLDRNVAVSPAVAARLREGGAPADRTRVIWDAVDPSRIRAARDRDAVRAALGVASDDPVVLCIARLVKAKGVDVLIEAVARLAGLHPSLVLCIAGSGPERAALDGRSRRLGVGDRVRFLGERSDVGDLLAACDLFTHPSRSEGLGVAVLEAMCAGRAVVASAVGGLRDLIEDGRCGVLVPPGDSEALAAAIGELLADPARRERLASAACERVGERHSPGPMIQAYERLYRSLLDPVPA